VLALDSSRFLLSVGDCAKRNRQEFRVKRLIIFLRFGQKGKENVKKDAECVTNSMKMDGFSGMATAVPTTGAGCVHMVTGWDGF
jgi:hypothetical protein